MSELKIQKISSTHGFTLIEIAIVVVIFSFLMSVFASMLLAHQERQKYVETERRMEVIRTALDEFLDLNGRLPCVARLDRRPGQAGFAEEVDSNVAPTIESCEGGIAGTIRFDPDALPALAGTLGGDFSALWARTGSLPVRSLNIPDEYILDAWGSRFTYVVSIRQASEDATGVSMYRENAGVLWVTDKGGDSSIDQGNIQFPGPNTRNFAEYAVISHGADQKGAIPITNTTMPNADFTNNATIVPCPSRLNEVQGFNCRHTNLLPNIIASDVKASVTNQGLDSYDDFVIYKAGTNFSEVLPSGAVIGFDESFYDDALIHAANVANPPADATNFANNDAPPAGGFSCPPGWAILNEAEGRFIMGATSNGTPMQRNRRSNAITITATTQSYNNLGATGEEENRTIPPYLTTIFCEKQ